MGEHKNTIIAIVLSLAVMVGWQILVGYPQMKKEQEQAKLKQQEQSQVMPGQTQPGQKTSPEAQSSQAQQNTPAGPPPQAPGVPNTAAAARAAASRATVIADTPRVAINTPRLGGSIDLKGGRIDDLTLTQYRETVDPKSPPIVLFAPSGAPDAYYAEFGWVPTSGTNAAIPGPDTVWQQQGSGPLSINHPVTLTYDNGQGLVFTRTIAIDD